MHQVERSHREINKYEWVNCKLPMVNETIILHDGKQWIY